MRGEQLRNNTNIRNTIGSLPLARGTVNFCAASNNVPRITPACAGNRRIHGLALVLAEDHPRLRGEQFLGKGVYKRKKGSPPLARGTGLLHCNSYFPMGITPACAGNRSSEYQRKFFLWDHPRLRGEQETISASVVAYLGSPPLARGTVYKYILK